MTLALINMMDVIRFVKFNKLIFNNIQVDNCLH